METPILVYLPQREDCQMPTLVNRPDFAVAINGGLVAADEDTVPA